MKRGASVVVIGGGVNGLGVAYHLAKAGVTDVVVLERKYVLYGASGRNGGGVRAQWGTPDNLVLARDSIRAFKALAPELGFNVWFRQGGYLFLAYDERTVETLKRNVAVQNAHGVRSRLVTPEDAHVLAPVVNLDGVVGGTFSPSDGIIFPWSVVQGYWKACRKMGVDVETFTEVTGLVAKGGRVVEVETSRGPIRADWVINAAGSWSRDVAAMAGVALPNVPVRHEIVVMEALKPFLDPMVVDLRNGLYLNQDMRGEVIAGIGHKGERPGINFGSSFRFMRDIARAIVDLVPTLADVKAFRQWAGTYDVTPDNKPVLGPSPGLDNFLQLNGASGHGFMISPVTTRITADLVLGRKPAYDLEPYLLDRFSKPIPIEPDAMVIG
ncbi:MAG TPA: FAD-binding oxidoreductase [Candidatus Thermoplasmatota archaeon]|nr:FAD-binding oxidoreductase [Candidatus Thermoplasmatota archaeon]